VEEIGVEATGRIYLEVRVSPRSTAPYQLNRIELVRGDN